MKSKNYGMTLYGEHDKKSDCDMLLHEAENVFGSIGKCVDDVLDEKKTKMQVVGSVCGILGASTKFLFRGGACVVKNTPRAVATVASAKRDLTETIAKEYQAYQKEQKEEALNEKIKQLKNK